MGKEEKRTLSPKLRFPEFRKEWSCVSVGDFFDLTDKAEKTVGFDKNRLLTVKLHGNGVVKNEKSTLTGGANYFTRKAGQFIFSKIDLLNGAFGVVPDTLDGFSSSSDVPAYSFDSRHSSTFFLSWLTANYGRLEIERTGTSSTLKRVSPEKFLALSLLAPSLIEQQKIAECLTSLDELIAAQGRKVEALALHKKGLMQQLFPREGETVPRLRFPEFSDDQTPLKAIGEFAKVTTGAKDTQNKVDDGKYPFFVRSQNVERIDSYSHNGEAVLTSGDGVGVGENYHYIKGRFDFHQRVYCIYDFADETSGQFFFYYFSLHFKKRVKEMSAKNSVDSVRMSMITEMSIWFPGFEEQLRIADCLSSLDSQIAAETEKLSALKTHKQGLMQQLFPN